MALIPMRRNPLTSLLSFAAERDREAASLGSVISQIAKPVLGGMGVQTDEMTPQPAVMRGPVPQVQPLGPMTGPAMAPTPVDFNPRSTELLSAADPRLREVLTETEKRARDRGIEIQISETKRDADRQADLVAQGKSQTMNSKHLTGNAADIFIQNPDGSANYDFEAYRPVADIAKEVAAEKGYDDLVWGGDWQTLKDGVHFQMGGAAVTGGGNAPSMRGDAGTDTLGTGFNVEDILAQLYPQMSPEDEKKQRRKDFFAAASQGFSALSQGRPQDFSNIRQAKEQRRTQAVQDMRERERARSAASLVYSQTGDAALATGIATGAISYNDVLTERQTRRANELADQQRIRDAESADAVATAMGRTGLYNEDDIAAVRAGTLTADQLGSVYEQGRLAEELRTEAESKQELATQNVIDAQTVLQSAAPGSIEARAAERVIALGGNENVYDIISARTPKTQVVSPGQTVLGADNQPVYTAPAAAGDGKSYEFQAQIEERIRSLGEDRATATRAVLDTPQAAGYSTVELPGGGFMVVPTASTAAPAGAVAPAVGAPAVGAPVTGGAPAGVAGAFNQQFGGMETGIPVGAPAPAVAAQAIPLDVATQVTELEQKRFTLQQARDAAPDDAARRAYDLQIADVNLQTAQLQLREAQAATGLDQREQELRIATAQANLDKAEREITDAEEGEKAAAAKKELRLTATTEAGTRQISKLLGMAADWNPGVAGGFERFIAGYLPGSEIYNAKSLVDSLNANSIITTIGVMKESSATGATGFGATTLPEISAMQDQLGKLDPLVEPELFVEQLQSLNNFILDSAYGTQSQIAENPNLTDAEKEFYSQRFDLRTGEIISLGLVPLDEGVVTMWQQGDIAPNLVVTPDDMTPEERAIYDSLN